jgi:hypothetical protein
MIFGEIQLVGVNGQWVIDDSSFTLFVVSFFLILFTFAAGGLRNCCGGETYVIKKNNE